MTGVKPSTALEMVKSHYAHDPCNVKKRGPKYKELPPDVRQYLLDSLHDLRFLTLQGRCDHIHRQFEYHISPSRLARNYRILGAKFQLCKTVMRASNNRAAWRHNERLEFTKKLVSLMVQGKHVIFADESSYNLWEQKRIFKTWMLDQDPISRVVNTKRLKNVTIFGAVSNKLPKLIFMQGLKTDTQHWIKFLKLLIKEVQSKLISLQYYLRQMGQKS